MSKTIGLDPLRDFCRYVLYTGFVKNAPRPVSALIVAPPERGKSTEAKRPEGKGIILIQDLTSFGIDRYLLELTEEDRRMFHHIVVPDLEKLKTRNRNVREELMAKMRIGMDEGIKEVCTGRDRVHFERPIQIGFLMCTTPDDLGDRRSVFRSLSWQSRIIPFTYDFSDALKAKILDFVENEEHNKQHKIHFNRREKVNVTLPKKYAKKLNKPARILAQEIERFSKKEDSTQDKTENKKHTRRLIGIRIKENFMTLLKAIALYHGSKTVKEEHYEEFRRLLHWLNYKYHTIDI